MLTKKSSRKFERIFLLSSKQMTDSPPAILLVPGVFHFLGLLQCIFYRLEQKAVRSPIKELDTLFAIGVRDFVAHGVIPF